MLRLLLLQRLLLQLQITVTLLLLLLLVNRGDSRVFIRLLSVIGTEAEEVGDE